MAFFKKYDLYILLPLLIFLLLRLYSYDGMLGQDGYAYVDYAKELFIWFNGGSKPTPFFWPPGFSLLPAISRFLGVDIAFGAQMVSCLSMIGILIFMDKLLEISHINSKSKSRKFYLLLFGLFAPYFLRNGFVTSSDMLATFCCTASLLFSYKYIQSIKFEDLLLGVLFLSYGVFTRYAIVLLGIPIAAYLVYIWATKSRKYHHLPVLIIPILIIALYAAIKENTTQFINHSAIKNWDIKNFVFLTFSSNGGAVHHLYPNIIFIVEPLFHLGFIVLGLLFIYKSFVLGLFKKNFHVLLIVSYFSYALFLAGYHEQNPRHLLIAFPLVLYLCFVGFDYYYQTLSLSKNYLPIVTACFVIQIGLCFRAMYPSLQRNKLEQNIVDFLQSNASISNRHIYGFDIDGALKSRNIPQSITSLYSNKISKYQDGDLILSNELLWHKQWREMNPMINWNYAKNNYQLKAIADFGSGWMLFEITPKLIAN